jgi:Homeodomain-like domain/DDE superfamily endonuclease
MPKKYIVDLSATERQSLFKLTTTGKHAAYKRNHAHILLLADINQADGGWVDRKISKALGISISTIERVRERFVEFGIDASLYKAFEPSEARRILNRLDFCYTPKHGSWLNMAEIELSVLSRQCLNRRIPDLTTLKEEVLSWCEQRNKQETWIDWRFTTEDARIKLKRLYPSINN